MDKLWNQIIVAFLMGALLPRAMLQVGNWVSPSETMPTEVTVASVTLQTEAPKPTESVIANYLPVLVEENRIVMMELEDYILGVVLAEMPASFHPEALKAQAVAARTYALRRYTLGDRHKVLPLLYSFGMTFFSGRGNELVFSGFDNYTRILEDKTFIKALQNTLFFAILIPPLVLVTSVYLANLINKITNRRFRSFITTVIYLPSIVSPVAYSFFFRRFFAVDGFLNTLLMYLGLLKEQQNFLLTPTGARIAIIMICLWAWTGYYTVCQAPPLSRSIQHTIRSERSTISRLRI